MFSQSFIGRVNRSLNDLGCSTAH